MDVIKNYDTMNGKVRTQDTDTGQMEVSLSLGN